MNTLPTNLIENVLALTGKTMEDMEIYERGTWNDEQGEMNDGTMEFSYPKFYAYLLSPEFIRSLPTASELSKEEIYKPYLLGEAIYHNQSGNPQPLIGLLSKI